MRALLAVAELRFRGATAARLPWLVVAAFAAGAGLASWAPGTDVRARAAAADGAALSVAAATAVVTVVVLAATAFAAEVRTTAAHALLSAPVSRWGVVSGGVLGHVVFGALLAVALAGGAVLGVQAGGLGARARGVVRAYEPARIQGIDAEGIARLGASSGEVRARFIVPHGLGTGETLRVRLRPRGQVDTSWSPAGVLAAAAGRPGDPGAIVNVAYKAGTEFAADVPIDGLAGGDEGELVLRHVQGGRLLRFRDGTVEVGGARELLTWNLLKAAACLVPLLALAACAGAAASARLGAAASLALVAFLLVVVAGRSVIEDGAKFVVQAAADEERLHAGGAPGHEGHHHVEVSGTQVALARTALVLLPAVPDASTFWRWGDLASGRAVRPADAGRALLSGVLPCAALLGASWLLLRRRELLPE